MHTVVHRELPKFSIEEAARARAASYLYQVYADEEGLLGDLDRWTQRRITEENMAKLALVFESTDPAETCYRDLIRELDTEAQAGIFLACSGCKEQHLRNVLDEPGVSGKLHEFMDRLAPSLFADEFAHSTEDLDLVWVTLRARHDRAHVDATISEIIMSHLLDNADAARDMSNAMRALGYSFHENVARRRCKLPRLLDERDERDLQIMVNELIRRGGDFEARIEEIGDRVDTV